MFFYDFEPIAINLIIPYALIISSRKGVNREAIGRQKWDPGEKNIKIHIILYYNSHYIIL